MGFMVRHGVRAFANNTKAKGLWYRDMPGHTKNSWNRGAMKSMSNELILLQSDYHIELKIWLYNEK